MKKILYISILILAWQSIYAQPGFSVSTDLSYLRSFTKAQKFHSFGQTVHAQWHLREKETIYAWISYFVEGKYSNPFTATAKDSSVSPTLQNYTSNSRLRYRTLSIGWKHYFKGNFYREDPGLSIYSLAGFGLLSGRVENRYDPGVDTSRYNTPQKALEGIEGFKRLTVDLGLGIETELFSSVYLYGEVRTWIPITDFPSPYLVNDDVPKVVTAGLGLRVLFY